MRGYMKFRYYITDMFQGEIFGTNHLEVVEKYIVNEEYFVVDTETNEWITLDGSRLPISEIK